MGNKSRFCNPCINSIGTWVAWRSLFINPNNSRAIIIMWELLFNHGITWDFKFSIVFMGSFEISSFQKGLGILRMWINWCHKSNSYDKYYEGFMWYKSVVMKSSMFMPHGVDDAFMPPWLPMLLLMNLKMYIASNWSELNPIHLSIEITLSAY